MLNEQKEILKIFLLFVGLFVVIFGLINSYVLIGEILFQVFCEAAGISQWWA